ncbi:MAG: AAA family ATPase [Verrucomicrobiales bacterium]|nr:AAA family ATPase [Verrucomicrobiales bacterium]
MKLTNFRIQNFKTIEDSDWIDVDEVCALVGKNESGKTSVLRALSKLKPTDGSEFSGLKEFPRSRYTAEFKKQDWPVVSAKFRLSDSEIGSIQKIHPLFQEVKSVQFTRFYSGNLTAILQPQLELPTVKQEEWSSLLGKTVTTLERMAFNGGDGLDAAKKAQAKKAWNEKVSASIPSLKESGEVGVDSERLQKRKQWILNTFDEKWERDELSGILDVIDEFLSRFEAKEKLDEAKDYCIDQMPGFIYFDNYGMLNSAIYLPEFVRLLKSGHRQNEARIQKALFTHVNADISELKTLSESAMESDPNDSNIEDPAARQKIDELTINANSAGTFMTQSFNNWWLQGDYKIRYSFNGLYFRIWVSDEGNEAEVELEERSAGFRYFLSFFLLFLVEAEENHENCILLLDEPGLHLHGRAQMDLIRFFDKIAIDNQIIYSTHSPFLVDADRIDRVRAVYKSPESGTKVSRDIWPKDQDSIFAIQGALGYEVCQSLFLSKKQLLVEGPSDFIFLKEINRLVPKEYQLDEEIVILPIGGCAKIVPFASLLIGHEVKFVSLLDSDPAGEKAKRELLKLVGDDSRITSYSRLSGDEGIIELEDLIPRVEFLAASNAAYSDEISESLIDPKDGSSIVGAVKSQLKSQGFSLDKLRVLRTLFSFDQSSDKDFRNSLVKFGESAFPKINAMLK